MTTIRRAAVKKEALQRPSGKGKGRGRGRGKASNVVEEAVMAEPEDQEDPQPPGLENGDDVGPALPLPTPKAKAKGTGKAKAKAKVKAKAKAEPAPKRRGRKASDDAAGSAGSAPTTKRTRATQKDNEKGKRSKASKQQSHERVGWFLSVHFNFSRYKYVTLVYSWCQMKRQKSASRVLCHSLPTTRHMNLLVLMTV